MMYRFWYIQEDGDHYAVIFAPDEGLAETTLRALAHRELGNTETVWELAETEPASKGQRWHSHIANAFE